MRINTHHLLCITSTHAIGNTFAFPYGRDNKTPCTENRINDASVSPEQIRLWWTNNLGLSIGMPMGCDGGWWFFEIEFQWRFLKPDLNERRG